MNEENPALFALKSTLSYWWPKSFLRVEEHPNGNVLAYFGRSHKFAITDQLAAHYTLKIRFHRFPHDLIKGDVQYLVGEISFGGVRLPLEYKQEVKQQMLNLLRKHGYIEKRLRRA